jgi:SOS-response transcriptional repressor LexA
VSVPETDLTAGQRQVVDAIRAFIQEHGYPPSQMELVGLVGVNLSTVQGYLARLRDAGVVAWEPGQFRTLRLL